MSEPNLKENEFLRLSYQAKSQFDKSLLTLSSGAIGVIVSFSKAKPFPWQHEVALWIFLGTVFCTLAGLLTLHYFMMDAYHFNTSDNIPECEIYRKRGKILESWNAMVTIFSGVLFFAGMVFTVLGFTS